jgi:hypothetical protein
MPKTASWGRGPLSLDNPEFESRVRASVGSPYADAVNSSSATQYPWNLAGLLGWYTKPSASRFRGSEYDYLREAGIQPQPDHVYAGKDTSSQTWSHEFRHRAGVWEEGSNRILDAYYAQSPAQWDDAVQMYLEFYDIPTKSQAEKELVERLKKHYSIPAYGRFSEEAKMAKKTGQDTYGPIDAVRGLLNPEWRDAADKVNAPWKIWASQKGLLD